MKEMDIKKHFLLLKHPKETELRFLDSAGNVRREFVYSIDELFKALKKHPKSDVFVAINGRVSGGSKATDVVSWNAFFLDIESPSHVMKDKPHARELALKAQRFFKSKGIETALADSGRGFHLYVFFNGPLAFGVEEIKRRLEKIKKFFSGEEWQQEKAHVDCSVFEPARCGRLIGTYNKKAKKLSCWIGEPKPADTKKVLTWIDSLPSPIVLVVEEEREVKSSKDCSFLEYALKHKLPAGKRNQILAPNACSVLTDSELQQLAKIQEMSKSQITGWKKAPSWQKSFNCTQMKKYAGELGLSHLCKDCLHIEREEAYYGVDVFCCKTRINVIEKIGVVYSREEKNGAVFVKPHYQIYAFKFGAGLNKEFYLFASPFQNYNLGESEFPLRKLKTVEGSVEFLSEHWPEKKILLSICKEHSIPTTEGEGKEKRNLEVPEIIENIAERQQKNPFLFTETPGVPLKELKKLKPEDWQEILADYLNEGYEKDPIIELTYKSDLPQPNPEKIKPKYYQPYNSNEMIYTNSKTGKTSTAKKTGVLVETATPSNLLGFSTAQETNEGSLNNQTKTLTLDEVQEEQKEEAYSGLSTYLETGECEVRKGKAKTNVRGYASVRFQGNPKLINDELYAEVNGQLTLEAETLFQRFTDCLQIISKNNQAFGGRIGFFVFRTDLKTAKRKKSISLKTLEKNAAIVETVFNEIKDSYTDLYFNETVLDWLNKGFSSGYSTALQHIEKKATLLPIKEFVEGHRTLAFKHLRGKALKLAVVDKALDFLNGNPSIEELLELAEEYVKELEETNLSSFSALVDVASKNEAMQEYLKKEFEGLPLHLKIVFKALHKYLEENSESESVVIGVLKNYFEDKGTFSEAEILRRTTKNLMLTNKKLRKFGLTLSGTGEEAILSLKNKEAFNSVGEVGE